ncbi:SAGA-associated factor 29 isoform X2 [Ixodes scapularis]
MQKEADNAVIQEKLRELSHVITQCQAKRNRSEHNLTNISKTHERIQQEQKLSPYYKSKLRGQYKTALQDAESEEELLRKALDIIFEIRTVRNERRIAAKNSERPKEALRRGALMKMLQQNALTLPLFISKEDEKPPPLCGAVPAEPNYVAKAVEGQAAADSQQSSSLTTLVLPLMGVQNFHAQ